MATLELWLVRHARPLVEPGVCYGRLDVPADPAHTAASAQALAAALQAAPQPAPTLPVWASPRTRTWALANALATLAPVGLSMQAPRADERLAEMDFGHWEGRRWDTLPRAELDAWTNDFHHHRPGGGENVAGFLARVRAALDDCHRQAQALGARRAVWVTHAGVVRAVQVWLAQTPQPLRAQDWPTAACDFGAWEVRHWPDLAAPLVK
ncbi:histidine phosphatase family protein [Macromonas nakdongensis]|uniref:histidine phosphatase family protein n=1 Tax=Macromonas nakdongensis TaxID=1843082 RepID=UPI000C34E0D5|nr:histidine phosphatase family protein [Macromonas nakdongensis]